MIRRWRRIVLAAALSVAVVVPLLIAWAVSTDSGTRWWVARVAAYLPPALSFEQVSGSVVDGLRIGDLRWRDDTVDVQIDEMLIELRISPLFSRHLAISSLRLDGARVELAEDRPEPESNEPLAVDVPLRISIDAAQLDDLEYVSGEVEQRIEQITLAGAIDGSSLVLDSLSVKRGDSALAASLSLLLRPPYSTELTADWSFPELLESPLSGEVSASGDVDALSVTHRLTAPAVVRTEAQLELGDDLPVINAVNEWDALQWTFADGRVLDTSAGRLVVDGSTAAFTLSGAVTAILDEWPSADITLDGAGTGDNFAFESLSIRSEAADLTASGTVDWRDGLRWDLDLDVENGQPAFLDRNLNGSINIVADSSGWWRQDQLQSAQLELSQLDGTLNDFPLSGSVNARVVDDVLTVETMELRVQDNRLEGGGTLTVNDTPQFDGRVTWSAPNIGALYDGASGSTTGKIEARGTALEWSLETALTGSAIRWQDTEVATLSVDGSLGADQTGELKLRADGLQVVGRDFDSFSVALEGGADAHTIAVATSTDGVLLDLNATGALSDETWRGQLDALSIAGAALGDWQSDSAAAMIVNRSDVTLEKLCLTETSARGMACLGLTSQATGAVNVDASLEGFPLAALPIALPPRISLQGQVGATLKATRENGIVDGELSVQLEGARASGQFEGELMEVVARQAELSAQIESNRLVSTGSVLLNQDFGRLDVELELDDVLAADSPLQASADVAVNDLSFVPLLLPSISAADGQVEGVLQLAGSVASPNYRGSIDLSNGAFSVPAAGINVTEMNVAISQSDPGRLQLRGIARSGEGRVSVTGFTQLAGEGEARAELRVNGENFEILRLPSWRATASPAVLVQVDGERTQVTGQITIPSADLELEGLPDSANEPSEDTFVHGRDDAERPAGRLASIDLQARLGDDVKLEGFGLTTGLTGAVRLRGVSNSPLVGLGRLDLTDGRYKAYGQELEIEQGALVFNGPLDNPVLDVRAVRRIDDVLAGLSLAGTPRSPQSTLYSEPVLSDAEILSYLITGRPLRSASAGEGEVLGQAAFALGLTGAGAIATQVGNTLGLDTLAVDGSGGNGRIVAGKRLGDRLLVEYGYGLVDKLGTLLLRYELNDKVVIESSTGSVSALDVVYSIKRN